MMQSYQANLKKRAPLWVWAILLALIITVVIIITLQVTGIFDFSFLAVSYLGVHTWSAYEVVNAVLLDAGVAILGAFIFYFFYNYVFGIKRTLPATTQSGYIPQAGLSSQPIQPMTQQVIEEVKK